MSSTRPYYRKILPSPTMQSADFRDDGQCVDLANLPPPPFGASDPVAQAIASSDDRAAALISAAVGVHARDSKSGKLEGIHGKPKIIWENQGGKLIPDKPWFQDWDLSEFKWYDGNAPSIYLLRSKCLAVMAYLDFFPDVNWPGLRPFVSSVVATANTGWCGTFGPGVDNAFDILGDPAEGNYDMNEMHLIPLAYRHYQDLTSVAREHLINVVLGSGRVHRPGRKDSFTSGKAPDDWTRAGYFHVQLGPFDPGKGIDETENHILMINSARYLTNQLLWQRTHIADNDNRRNGGDGSPSCLDLTLSLLRNILRDDFSEYNAKNYQEETRYSLLNLCTYAYDHEVRLGARMVLDYISAHMAVSTNDLRRMVPFRRRDEDDKVAHDAQGFMSVNLLAASGSDPMGPYFAMQAGNTRACVATLDVPVPVGGIPGGAPGESKQPGINGSQQDVAIEVLTDYRLPPSIHDLFVNDAHRRFFQRIHRIRRDEAGGNRNCDNAEIYASSPSYLITAGGSGATYAIDPSIFKGSGIIISPSKYQQELGVAVTTSFMPTTGAGGIDPQTSATDLIQFSSFSDDPVPADDAENGVANYGVAPDFVCGHQIYLPKWTTLAAGGSGFSFGDFGSSGGSGKADGPGFYLAIFQENGLALMEAFDTWLHPNVTFADFQSDVLKRNPTLHLNGNTPTWYTTWNGNQIQFVIWTNGEYAGAKYGAAVLSMKYGNIDVQDALGDAGNINTPFLNGTIMSSPAEAVVEIRNPFLGTVIRLDMSDKWHPKRTAEDGTVEWAGSKEEVWLDFQWPGPTDGDVCHPFNKLAAASAAVANYGTIRIIPSLSHERGPIGLGKRFKLVAPIAGVTIGAK